MMYSTLYESTNILASIIIIMKCVKPSLLSLWLVQPEAIFETKFRLSVFCLLIITNYDRPQLKSTIPETKLVKSPRSVLHGKLYGTCLNFRHFFI